MDVRLFTWPAVQDWSVAAEDGVPRVLVVDPEGEPDADFDDVVAAADERLEEELCTPVLPVHADDGRVVGLLDVLAGTLVSMDGTAPAPPTLMADAAQAVEELTEMVLVCTPDEALVERVRLGLSLSPPALRAAIKECLRLGLMPLALPVTAGGLGQGLLDAWVAD